MNTLVQNYPMSYALPGDFKFHPQDRHYPANSLATNDLIDSKAQLTRNSLSQSMSFGNPGIGLDYSSAQLQHEPACNTVSSQLILTPPQSGDEASSTLTNPSSSTFPYSLPKVTGSNVPSSDYYSSNTSGFGRSPFNGNSMTQLDGRVAAMQIPAPLSPPYSYGPLTSNSFPSGLSMARPHDYNYPSQRNTMWDPFNRPRPAFPPASYPSGPSHIFPNPPMAASTRPEGPPFEDTQTIHSLVNSRGQSLKVDVLGSIPKGFFKVDDKWTCYRRNYFSVNCGFTFKTHSLDTQLYVQRYSQPEQVQSYAVSIAARTAAVNNSESEPRGLVQHTPKRDKATESVPTRHPVIATPAQSLTNGHHMPHNGLYSSASHGLLPPGLEPFGHPGGQSPQTSYTFERIQFQKATANNGKRRAQQQYFHVVVRLEVNVGRPGGAEDWLVVATKQSHPMVVRGRSPGHYKDNRRDSTTSMDPDGGSGHSADGHPTFGLHSLGSSHSSSMNGSHSSYRPAHHYGTSYSHTTHRMDESDSSSTSPGSSATLCSSPHKGENCHISNGITRSSHTDANYDRIVLSPITNKQISDSMDFAPSKKRSYDDDNSDCTSSYFQNSLDSNYHTPAFDFSATSSVQALCASS